MGLQEGDILRDRYLIATVLGKGGFGVTYLAQDLELPKQPEVVIKEITPSLKLSWDKNEFLFEREAAALQELGKHSQIPRLFARFIENDKFYLVQEYISGITLEAKLKQEGTFSEAEVMRMLREVLLILREVHRQNPYLLELESNHKQYIHRDIKPSNLICREKDNQFCLIDFGAVKEISGMEYTNQGQLQSTLVVMASGYTPPEQLNRHPQYSSDLYALGITAIRLLTGLKPPVSSDDSSDSNSMRINPKTGEIIWQELTSVKVSPKLIAILNKMTCYCFSDRYQSAKAVLQDLEPLIINPNPKLNRKSLLLASICGLFLGAFVIEVIPRLLEPKYVDYAIDLDRVCNDPLIKGQKLNKYHGSIEYIQLKNSTAPIWSVFNWKCVFTDRGDTQIKGIDLDRYCSAKYSDSNYQYEAYFKNYRDKNSWYCTNVGTKLENSASLEDSISSGEEIINRNLPIQTKAAELFAERQYAEAAVLFMESWQKEAKDPQTLIYLNNTFLELSGKDYHTIAVTVPLTSKIEQQSGVKNIDLAYEMLRGIAQAQTEVNLGLNSNQMLPGNELLNPQAIADKGLKIIIADDANDPEQAVQIANRIINRQEVLGVIGNYASDTTNATIDLFNNRELTLISPGSTSEELTNPHRKFFFRTIPTVIDTGEELANHLFNKIKLRKAAIFYNPESPYTRSIRKEFKQVWEARGGRVVLEYDNLQLKNFDPLQAINKIKEREKIAKEKIAIVLFPDGQVTPAVNKSLEIIAQSNGNNWMVGGATVYNPKTLEIDNLSALKKLIVAVPWHPDSSPNLEFTDQSIQLWNGEVNHRTALAYDATRTFIHGLTILSENSQKITRINLQKTISDPAFSTQGAIGTIRFTPNGNRRNPFVELVKVIECQPPYKDRVSFVPLASNKCSQF